MRLTMSMLMHAGFCLCAPRADPGLYMIPDPGDTKFLIGGWGPGDTPNNFLRRYKPIFQDYLTAKIGHLYDPPISFDIIATDWGSDETTTSHVLIEKGELDFTCKPKIADRSNSFCYLKQCICCSHRPWIPRLHWRSSYGFTSCYPERQDPGHTNECSWLGNSKALFDL